MSGSREEERRKLADIINHWNANRLDLFEISRPTEVGGRGQEQERPGGGWWWWGWPAGLSGGEWRRHLARKPVKKTLLWAASRVESPLKNVLVYNVAIKSRSSGAKRGENRAIFIRAYL